MFVFKTFSLLLRTFLVLTKVLLLLMEKKVKQYRSHTFYFMNLAYFGEWVCKYNVKMNIYRLYGMALSAVLLCVNLASCGSDFPEGNPENGIVSNERKLVTIEEEYEDGDLYTYTFSYDSKGRAIAVTTKDYYYEKPKTKVTNIAWSENTIVESRNGEDLILTLVDGLILKGENSDDNGCTYLFAYNPLKKLSIVEHSHMDGYDSSTTEFYWEGNKFSKYEYTDGYYDEEVRINYSGKTCKGYYPLWGFAIEDDCYTLLAHPELLGFRSNYLPSQIITQSDYSEYVTNISYTLDRDGYIETCTMSTFEDGDHYETVIYTFKWQ